MNKHLFVQVSQSLRMLLVAVAASALVPATSMADPTYPTRPISLVSPFSPGGGADAFVRIWATSVAKYLNGSMVVENKDGANGVLALSYVAKAPADGYTLVVTSGSMELNPFTYDTVLPYKDKDFDGVAVIGTTPEVLVAAPSLGVRSVAELVEKARAKPNEISYGSGGFGNSTHLNVDSLARHFNVKLMHIPFKGIVAAMSSVLGNHTQLVCSSPIAVLPQVRAGKVVPLTVFGPARISDLPGVPTSHELGIEPTMDGGWYGIAVPKGTPKEIIAKLNAATNAMWDDPDAKPQLAKNYFVRLPDHGTTAVMDYVQRDAKVWGPTLSALMKKKS